MITNNSLSEIGDVLYIYSQVVVAAEISISSYSDNLFGVTANRFFSKQFKYSLDGVNYSEYAELNNLNLQQINGTVNGLLFFEFRYERVGTDSTGILEFNSIELIGEIQIQIVENTSTLESIFSDLSKNDFYTMSVRNNILRKIFYSGILPRFIERGNDDDEDFISFWSAVCIYLSYFSSFANKFDKIVFTRDYLAEYIKQTNLQINEKEITYQHLYYLSNNFYDEIRKRGTQMTFKKVDTELLDGNITKTDGEWLRLICRNHYDEFLVEVIEKKHNGFCLNQSSFLYNGTYFSKQLNKTEENTSDFLDLSKYILIGNPTIETTDSLKCLTINSSNEGLGYDLINPPAAVNPSELISIDEEIDYEITFNFKRTGSNSVGGNLSIGILCFNRNGVIINQATKGIQNNLALNEFINEPLLSISKINNQWYSFRAILYSKYSQNISDGRTNLNKGRNLKIANDNTQKVDKVKICIYSNTMTNSFNLYLHDFKMRPLIRGKNILNNSSGGSYIRNPQFLQSTNFCLNWRRNNNQDKTDNQVDNFIQNYLLPYQQKLISIPLTPYVDDKQIL